MLGNIIVSLAAGMISAVVLIAATQGSILSLFAFVFLAPLPVIIVGFGWGWRSALFAAIVSAVAMTLFVTLNAGVSHLIAVGLPMAMCSYLLMLNRATNEYNADGSPAIEWYPPGRVLAALTLMAGSLAAILLFSIAGNESQLEIATREYTEQLELKLPDEMTADDFAKLMARGLTPVAATFWIIIACFNLWLGAWVTQVSGRLARPWPDLSLMMLPNATPLALMFTVGFTFLPGYPGLIALGFASAILFAYIIVGLAIIHNITRGLGARPFILFMVYAGLLLFNPFSSIIVAMIAIGEPISPIRRRFQSSSPKDGGA